MFDRQQNRGLSGLKEKLRLAAPLTEEVENLLDDIDDDIGVVYFLQGKIGGPVKIGWTLDMDNRLKQIQSYSPDKLTIVWSTEGTRSKEAHYHRLLKSNRIHGEWFKFTIEVLSFVRWLIKQDCTNKLTSLKKRLRKPISQNIDSNEFKNPIDLVADGLFRLNSHRLHPRNTIDWKYLGEESVEGKKEITWEEETEDWVQNKH
jgi:hypothetical protein